jgi:hypothetical protein
MYCELRGTAMAAPQPQPPLLLVAYHEMPLEANKTKNSGPTGG